MNEEALHILKKYWGYDSFREPQEAVIKSVLEGNDTLALIPTGGGKSITFQVPAMMKEGICIVVSPLIALMTDQIEALKQKNIKALSLSGALSYSELDRLLNNAFYGQYKFLYLSPERLKHELVRTYLKALPINLIVIDEAHCVSHWGNDFRPAYLHCKWLKETFTEVPVLALTASATPKVQKDLLQLLGIEKAKVISTSLQRPNIAYKVYEIKEKFPYLFELLHKSSGSVIIYLRSRNATSYLSGVLNDKGFNTTFFHGGLTSEEKNIRLKKWLNNEVRIMVATNAFGMGIDKPDVRMVLHWNIPLTLEDYFQEAGRAGRDGKPAEAILAYDRVDIDTAKKLLNESLIDLSFLKLVYAKLNQYFQIAIGDLSEETHYFFFPDFCKRYNLPTLRAYNALQTLDRFSVISLSQQFYQKVTLHLSAGAKQQVEYNQTHKHLSSLLFYLGHTYPYIFSQPAALEIEKITERTDLTYPQLMHYLQEIHNDGIGVLTTVSTDVQLTFNVPRDDDRTINTIAKNVKLYNHTKKSLQEQVYAYLEDNHTCRSVQLLQYFGEPAVVSCGVCSNCLAKLPQPKVDTKLLRHQLWQLLQEKPISPAEIISVLPYPREAINALLEEWLTMGKIAFTVCNELFVPTAHELAPSS